MEQRDAENRESLSMTLRNLRADNLKQTNDISRLSEKHIDAQRKLDIAEASETAIRAQLKSADAAVRGLKEEMARAKILVAQTRASCATEVRRRDRQIDGLKKQLGDAGRARGSARNQAVTVINVMADTGDEKTSPARAGAVTDTNYDLRNETNEFLTELAKNLSEENEALLAVTRRTLAKLREMSGWDRSQGQGDGHAVPLQTDCAEIEAEMESILEHLRNILTNPSFVPIEEVEIREEEINRLKEGWIKMESRWQEAVHLITGWRKRMVANGKGVNIEELNQGLRLSPVRVRDAAQTSHVPDFNLSSVQEEPEDEDEVAGSPCPPPRLEESLHLEPAADYQVDAEEPESDSESSIFEDDIDIEELEVSEPNVEILQQSTAFLSSSPLPSPPQLSPLKDSASAGNRGNHADARAKPTRPGDCSTIAEENTWDLAGDAQAPKPPPHRINLPRSPQKVMRSPSPDIEEKQRVISAATECSLDEVLLVQEAVDPPSPSPMPKDRSRPLRKPSRNDIQQKMSEAKKNSATREDKEPTSQPRRSARTRDISSRSVEDDLPPRPPAHQTPRPNRNRSPIHGSSRLPLPRPANPPPHQSPLTMANIAAKLAASEREADAARVRAKLKAARGGRRVSTAPNPPTEGTTPPTEAPHAVSAGVPRPEMPDEEEDMDPIKRSVPEPGQGEARPPQAEDEAGELVVPKRKRERRVSKVASRRRSTLSPWEMQSLISGAVAVSSPVKPAGSDD
jgi:hypothetical protein